jgi:predicted acylesterase/phospholipase RssA/CRP-like cAMP-binding protein
VLKKNNIFSHLSEQELHALARICDIYHIKKGEHVFQQGEQDSNIYLIDEGLLFSYIIMKNNSPKPMGFIRAGEFVGELRILTQQPRSLSVKASVDSVLLRIDKDQFETLCKKNSTFLWHITKLIAKRSVQNIDAISNPTKIHYNKIALIPLSKSINVDPIINRLNEENIDSYKINIISDEIVKQSTNIKKLLQTNTLEGHIVIFPIISLSTCETLLEYAERIVVVIDERLSEADLDIKLWNVLTTKYSDIDKELMILHQNDAGTYRNYQHWIKFDLYYKRHHVFLESKEKVGRFLRFMCGKAVGLVLSGGGARGWGIIGALRAIQERNITIDYIGGTSIGACIGAHLAMGDSIEYEIESSVELTKRSFFSQITWPIISLFSASYETKFLKKMCGDTRIEDMSIPFFCVSSNITQSNEHIWKTGPLWKALRASISIPMFFPPMLHHGDMHVDGSITNNYPSDIMHSCLSNKGVIIGIHVNDIPRPVAYNFPPNINFFRSLLMALKIRVKNLNWPSIKNIYLQSIYYSYLEKDYKNISYVDVHIAPDLQQFKYTDFKKSDEMIAAGYKHAMKELSEIDNL